jgi:hypothetical protein
MENASEAIVEASMDNGVDTSIEVSTGGATFDDFDAVEDMRQEVKEVKLNKESKKNGTKKEATGSNEQEEEIRDSAEKPEEVIKEEKADDNEQPQENAEKKQDLSKIKAKKGDEEVEIDKDYEVEVTVNGEKKMVKIQDALNSFSGQSEITRRFTALDKERKQFQAERNDLYSTFSKFEELAKGENKLEAFNYLLDFVEIPRYDFFKGLRENLLPQFQQYLSLTDDERSNLDVKTEAEFLKSELKKRQDAEVSRKQAEEYRQQLTQLKKQNSLTDEVFDTRVQEIQGLIAKGTIGLRKEEVTPQFVVDYHKSLANVERVENALQEINIPLSEEQKLNTIKVLNKYPHLDDASLKRALIQASGIPEKSKILQDKSSNRVQMDQAKSEKLLPNQSNGFESFDDFEEY